MSFVAAAITGTAMLGSTYLGASMGGKSAKKEGQRQQKMSEAELYQRYAEFAEQQKQFGQMFGQRQSEFERTQGFQEQRQASRQKAYYDMIEKGKTAGAAGEGALMASLNAPSAQLANVEQDILSGQSESMQQASSQMQANLAQQGVRGGQAATQLRRGTGEIGASALKDITQLKYKDEQRREASKRAYLSAKAGAGTSAQYQPAYF